MDALIWGASGGIGSALVTTLKQGGWRVFAAARRIERIPVDADFKLPFDTEVSSTWGEVNQTVAHETDGLDLVVYAAGSLRSGMLTALSPEDWAVVMAGNLTGAYLAASSSISLMKQGGHMVFIGAYVDHLLLAKMGAYAAAKAGLEPLVAVLRKEQRSMRFTIVRPGPVDTDLWSNAPFKKPSTAKSPAVVAQAILDHHQAGANGDLNL